LGGRRRWGTLISLGCFFSLHETKFSFPSCFLYFHNFEMRFFSSQGDDYRRLSNRFPVAVCILWPCASLFILDKSVHPIFINGREKEACALVYVGPATGRSSQEREVRPACWPFLSKGLH
jgi:hypothetical protein